MFLSPDKHCYCAFHPKADSESDNLSIHKYLFFVTQILKYYSSTYVWGKNSFSYLLFSQNFTVIHLKRGWYLCKVHPQTSDCLLNSVTPVSWFLFLGEMSAKSQFFYSSQFLSAGISNRLCLINSIIYWDRKSNISVTTIFQVRAVLYQHNGSRLFLIIE